MNLLQEQRLITDIKQVLDSQSLDQDSRFALQKARAHALQNPSKSWWQTPWLSFAAGASLMAVLVINLPGNPVAPTNTTKLKPLGVTVQNPPDKSAAKPVVVVVEKPTTIKSVVINSSVDADLLEYLEFYEEAEFYQWLSEQDPQGATDA